MRFINKQDHNILHVIQIYNAQWPCENQDNIHIITTTELYYIYRSVSLPYQDKDLSLIIIK